MRVYPPAATENGRPIRGLVRSDFVVTEREADHSLADRDHAAYAVLDPDSPDNVLTVRDSVDGTAPDRAARASGASARDDGGKAVADPTRVYMAAKFEPGKIYEVVYTAQAPPVVGLGPAAIRDVISMLKYSSAEPLVDSGWRDQARARASASRRAAASCAPTSTTGSTATRRNRKVFDGVIAHVAGAGRGSFNHRFAQPSRDGHPYLNFFYPTDIFPFTDVAQKDPETGVDRRPADARRRAGAAAEDLLHELGIRVLGPRRVAHPHDRRRQERRAADGQRADLSAHRRAAWARRRSRRRRRSASSGTTRSTTAGR